MYIWIIPNPFLELYYDNLPTHRIPPVLEASLNLFQGLTAETHQRYGPLEAPGGTAWHHLKATCRALVKEITSGNLQL